jgi:hypothetical protein
MDNEEVVWQAPTMQEKLQNALGILGEKWVLHPANAPLKGFYDNRGREQIIRQTQSVCPSISE